MHMYESESLLVAAESPEDAVAVVEEVCGLEDDGSEWPDDGTRAEHFEQLPDDTTMTCGVTPEGSRPECGYEEGTTPLTLTWQQWAEREGRGIFGDENAC